MKVLNTTLKKKLIILCMLVGTVPAVIVGIFSYSKASDTIQNKVDEGNMRILQQVRMSVEQLLLISDHVMYQLIESPAIKSTLSVDMEGSEFKTFSDAETVINNLPTADIGNRNILIANFSKGWIITYNGIFKLEDFDQKNLYNSYLKLNGSSVWVDSMTLKSKGISNERVETDGVNLIKKYPLFINNPESIAVMSIPYSKLSELVANNDMLGEVMVVGQDGCVIAHSDKKMWGKDVSGEEYFKLAAHKTDNSGNYIIPMNGQSFSINYVKSSYNNWIYISITSLDSVTKDSKTIGWFTFFVCLGVIILINIIAYLATKRIYTPIGKLYNLIIGYPDFTDIPDKKDELVLIEDRVSYLLKNQVKLKKQVINQIEQLKEFFQMKLILNEIDKELIESRVKLYEYPPMPDCACVWVISIDTLENTKYMTEDMDLMLFAVNNIVGELLESSVVFKPVVIDKYQVTIVGDGGIEKAGYKNNVYNMAKHVQDVVKKALNFSISIGISTPIQDYSEINRGYIEGIEALKHQILLGYNAIIFIEDVHRGTVTKPIFPSELEEDILSSVKMCNREKALEQLHLFVDRVFKSEVSRYEYQISIIRLATDLIFILKESGESYNVLVKNGESIYDKLLNLKTVGEIECWFAKTLIEPIIYRLESVEGCQYKKISDEVIKLIHEEYDCDLTLEECAARMNYHPSYIRRILKREMGISFSEYLAQYRMDMAKKWLTETDMKVSDIAEKLRYKNSENFIRGFKKVTGVTPGQYREQNMQ